MIAPLLSLLLAVPSSAAPEVRAFDFPAASARLTVLADAPGAAPDAVFYDGAKGRWLVRASELRDLETAPGMGWTDERGELWSFAAARVEHRASSWSPAVDAAPWAEPAALKAVETLISLLQSKGKQPAAEELFARGADLRRASAAASARASSLSALERERPGAVLDAAELARDASAAASAKDVSAKWQRAREGVAPASASAEFYWEQERMVSAALSSAAAAERSMDALVVPAY